MPIFGVRTDLIIPQLFVVSFKYVEQQRGNGSWKSTEVYCMLKSMCHIETVYKKKKKPKTGDRFHFGVSIIKLHPRV